MKLKNKQTLLRFGKTGLRLLTSAALMAAPAGIAGVVLKSVTRHFPWEKHEKTAK